MVKRVISFNSKTQIIGFMEFSLISQLLIVPFVGVDDVVRGFLEFIYEICLKNIKGGSGKQGKNMALSSLLLQKLVLSHPNSLQTGALSQIFEAAVILMNSEVLFKGSTEAAFSLMCSCVLAQEADVESMRRQVDIMLPRVLKPIHSLMYQVRSLCLIASALIKMSTGKDFYFYVAAGLCYQANLRCMKIKENKEFEIADWCEKKLPEVDEKQSWKKAAQHEHMVMVEEGYSDDDGHGFRESSHAPRRRTGRGTDTSGGTDAELNQSLKMMESTDLEAIDPFTIIRRLCCQWKHQDPELLSSAAQMIPFLKDILYLTNTATPKGEYSVRKVYSIKRLLCSTG